MATMKHVDAIRVLAWGETIGAAAFDPSLKGVVFEYADNWRSRQIELAPLTMPIDGRRLYRFPDLDPSAFKGLPGLLADALPDKFGNQLIDAWMQRRGYRPEDVSVLDRLAYMGERTMGALTFKPSINAGVRKKDTVLEIGGLVDAARRAVKGTLTSDKKASESLKRVISVGTSAGGARAKAVLAISRDRTQVLSGQFDAPEGFDHWLLKFDGMGKDDALGDSQQYGRIEYAYSKMARAAGITMTECDLLEESGRAHFMTRRFDRIGNERVHVQSFCALTHRSFNFTGVHSYESLMQTAVDLDLDDTTLLEIFRRMAFNVAAANHDDHTKNFAFLLPRAGQWSLSPAFDVTFAYSETGQWTSQHQMSVNGKFRGIEKSDLLAVAELYSIPGAKSALQEIDDAIGRWSSFAVDAGVDTWTAGQIASHFTRL
jgi:serine/threonine-protein kinase HipA